MQLQKTRKVLNVLSILFIFASVWNSGALVERAARAKEIIQPPEEMQSCERADDCVEIEISCSHCCKPGAINKKFLSQYTQQKLSNCKSYQGKFCNCVAVPVSIDCLKSKCTAKAQLPTGPGNPRRVRGRVGGEEGAPVLSPAE